MSNQEFQLGDTAVVVSGSDIRSFREPSISGTVIARGPNTVKIQYIRSFLFFKWVKEEWFCIEHYKYHTEKAKTY